MDSEPFEKASRPQETWDALQMERAMAKTKSYTGAAVLVFILYWVFWLPGFIVNLIYYNEAKKMEKVAGQSLPGMGCLTIQLALGIIGLILAVVFSCSLTGGFFSLF
jgi:hypothetical protein